MNEREDWLSDLDSNQDNSLQRAVCYRYTIGQAGGKPRRFPGGLQREKRGNSVVTSRFPTTLRIMFRALQLLISPGSTWVKIATAKRGVVWNLFLELLPLLLITCAAEGYVLAKWGERTGQAGRVLHYEVNSILVLESLQVVLSLAMVFMTGVILRWVGESFHFYPPYRACFTLAVFGFSPFFIIRLGHYLPGLNEWVGPALGALACVYVLYQGVGAVLEPDQTKGFGLYILSALIFTLLCGMDQLLLLMAAQSKLAV